MTKTQLHTQFPLKVSSLLSAWGGEPRRSWVLQSDKATRRWCCPRHKVGSQKTEDSEYQGFNGTCLNRHFSKAFYYSFEYKALQKLSPASCRGSDPQQLYLPTLRKGEGSVFLATFSGWLAVQKASFWSEEMCHAVNTSSGAWVSSTYKKTLMKINCYVFTHMLRSIWLMHSDTANEVKTQLNLLAHG